MLKFCVSNLPHHNTWYAIGMLCDIYNATGRSQKVIDLIHEKKDLWSVLENSTMEIGIKKDLAEAYGHLGNSDQAYLLYRDIWHKRDSMDMVVDAVLFSNLEADSALRSEYHAMGRIKKKAAVSAWIIGGMAIACASLLILILYYRYNSRKLKSRNLELIHNAADAASDTLQKLEILKEDLDKAQRKVASSSLLLGQMSEITNRITILLANKGISATEKLSQIKDTLRTSKESDTAWNAFISQLEQIHPSFFCNLRYVCPSLTSSEIKICGFILLNVSTKDIADLTYRSTRTIENLKYNLRKKLGITESTEAFLEHIASASKEDLKDLKEALEARKADSHSAATPTNSLSSSDGN